jgi:beta-glucosidase
MQTWFAGEMGGRAVADVLSGADEPGGRLPHTIPKRIEDSPAFPFYPGPEGHAPYGEGLLLGNRHYRKNGIAPRYPFGHGLGYTTFEWSGIEISAGETAEAAISVSCVVTNTGERRGSDVVQAYVHGPASDQPSRPEQQLAGLAKVTVNPGESETVTIEVPGSRLRRYEGGRAVVDSGSYEVRLGRDAASVELSETVTLEG